MFLSAFFGMPGHIELLILAAVVGVPLVVLFLVYRSSRRAPVIYCESCGNTTPPPAEQCPHCGQPFKL